VDTVIETLRRDRFIEVKGAAEYAKATYKFSVTDQGKRRAAELLDVCRYVGPAPVPLDDYRKLLVFQTIKNIVVIEENMKKGFFPV